MHNRFLSVVLFTDFSVCIGHVESVMRNLFEITEDKEIRIWNKYMSNTYELLSRKDQTIQDCGLYNGQVRLKC